MTESHSVLSIIESTKIKAKKDSITKTQKGDSQKQALIMLQEDKDQNRIN